MSDDYDDSDDGEGGGGGAKHEVYFDDETAVTIIAGKYMELSGLKRSELGKLKLAADELGKAKGIEGFTLIPSGDFSADSGPGPDESTYSSFVVGVLHGSGGTYGPEQLTRERALEKLERAKAIADEVWQAFVEKLPEARREGAADSETQLYVVPVGPLAYAKVAFGVEGSEEDGGDGEYVVGTHMDQERHETGVWGQRVAGGEDPEVLDLSESAHQARVAAFPEGKYYLISRYD